MPKKITTGGRPSSKSTVVAFPAVKKVDPLNVNTRLYNQIARLLDELEDRDARQNLDIKERIAAMIAIGRIQTIFLNLRLKENTGGTGSGSAVKRYAAAFKNDARRGATRARSAAADDDFAGDDLTGDDGNDTA